MGDDPKLLQQIQMIICHDWLLSAGLFMPVGVARFDHVMLEEWALLKVLPIEEIKKLLSV